MVHSFVTTPTFNKAMKSIDQRFEIVDKRFNEMEIMVRNCMEEQRVFFSKELGQFVGVIFEEMDKRFAVLMEHPVFANYKA